MIPAPDEDEQQIHALFEAGDRALIAADHSELDRIYADDYVQYDESGQTFTKRQIIANLTSGKTRYVKMLSASRKVRVLTQEVAVVHGSEEDEVEQSGERHVVRYIYMDVVIKREGRWQIVGSQLAKPPENPA